MDKNLKPPFIMTGDPGSFAEFTIKNRKPMILERVARDNQFSSSVNKGLEEFLREIKSGIIQPLNNQSQGAVVWNRKVAEFAGKTWSELPWFFAETYFYRRVCEITGYYELGNQNYLRDPFKLQKKNFQ